MNKQETIKDKYHILNVLTLACILIATFFLPLKTSLSNFGLIGLVITTFIAFGVSGFQKKGKLSFFILFSPMVFFLPLLWGWVYSPIQPEAFKEISKYVFLGLVPLLLFRKDIQATTFRKYASMGLLAGAVLSAVILIAINLYNYSKTDLQLHWLLNNDFTGINFVEPFSGMHTIYMGIYYVMAIAILLFGNLKLRMLWRVLIFTILVLGIIFIASRISYFITVLLIGLYLIHNLSFKIFSMIATITIIIGVLSFSFLEQTYIYKKTVEGTEWELQDNIGTYNTDNTFRVDSRYSRWKVALEAIKEKPILGFGGGTENEILLEKYKTNKMQNSINREYNAHNQFLGATLRFGIFGFLLMLVYFVRNSITAFKYQNLLFLSFLTILFWSFMIENVLDRNMGINFVALFGTLFYAEFLAKESKLESNELAQ